MYPNTSTKTILLKAFNKHFFDFIEDIMRICPERPEILTSKQYFDTMRTANPTLILKVWYNYICQPYSEKIVEGDLNFFFEKDYTHDLRMMKNSEEIMKVVDSTIRDPLRNMSEDNMDKCRKHFQLISTICTRYMEETGKAS